VLREDELQKNQIWWPKEIWQFGCPLKAKILIQFVLSQRVPTWDFMQRRSWHGPGRCPLCKICDEDIGHMLIRCPFSGSVWKEIEVFTGLRNIWEGQNVKECMNAWCQNPLVRMYTALLIIVAWGICLARNSCLFEDRIPPPQLCASQGLSILKYFEQVKVSTPPRVVVNKVMDKSRAWASFDGVVQGDPTIGGAEGILYLSDCRFLKFKADLGGISNNKAKLLALNLILKVAVDNAQKLQVMGDSKVVINSIKGGKNYRKISSKTHLSGGFKHKECY